MTNALNKELIENETLTTCTAILNTIDSRSKIIG